MAEQNIFAELQRRQDKYADLPKAMRDWLFTLSPEELEAFEASMDFGDQEMMAEVQRQLPEELRFGGEFGLPSAIAYGKDASDRAQIRNYTYDAGLPNILGFYTKSARGLGMTPEFIREQKRLGNVPDAVADNPLARYISSAPDYDPATGSRGITVFQPLGSSSEERAYRRPEGLKELSGSRYTLPQTITHELTHKFFDSPAFLDFLEETGRNSGKPLTSRKEHDYIESVESIDEELFTTPALRRMYQNNYRDVLNEFRQWMTPEKEEKYGIRMPIRSLPPEEPPSTSTVDKIIDFIRGR